ncbi:hypothetical protein [Breoghania sp.]|uniref:hypothetical protein n=1 Tax=Breoghania sp. TaxID=2065378 RepID=UPI0029C9D05A|nr:hypothetical protein [Breoghania sp.]
MRKTVKIADIDASNRLRPINPTWAETIAEGLRNGDEVPPIKVVEQGEKFRLIFGGHRLEGHVLADFETIEVDVRPSAEYPDEASIRLEEIRENMIRYELTALDRAVHLAAWKALHEEAAGPAKRGRKSKAELAQAELAQNSAAIFAGTFSAAAAAALGVSERSVQVAVQVANGIVADVRETIAFLPIADTMSELLKLAALSPERQKAVADMLAADPPRAGSVADAVALISDTPKPAKPAAWERLSDKFSRLKPGEQKRFFELHRAEIETWLAGGDDR